MRQIPVVWSAASLGHDPGSEVWVGVPMQGSEVAERVEVIKDTLTGTGASLLDAVEHDDTILHTVHDPDFVRHLATIHEAWLAAGFVELAGQDRVVPYVFPTEALLCGLPLRTPTAIHGRAGRYGYDTMTLVGPGSWPAIRGAVDAALTAVDLVRGDGDRPAAPVAYALCRPPGHHATPTGYGGSCYLNNAAVAAEALHRTGADRVAIVDLDAHHGNGTQAIFYDRPDVYYGSLHIDPGAGWFPHYVGYAEERGRGAGTGTNRNRPLAEGTGDDGWLAALTEIVDEVSGFGPEALVVSLGVDAALDDPESPLRVSQDGYHRAGELIGDLGVPTVAVQEGGYHLPTLGPLVQATLTGLIHS
ncbi:MAG TPA: histone deacetylase family protein [Actinomycetes bacterium]|nr:histone deacetylase family protein [Actinomycetes bacterium]